MFIDNLTDLSLAVSGHYNLQLVLISLVAASLAAGIAFLMSGQLNSGNTPAAWIWRSWCLFGALVMGGGIWSMHLVNVLAMNLPVPFSLDISTTLLSVVPVVVAAGFVLKIDCGSELPQSRQWVAATVLGTGIVGMHYSAMTAMRVNATISYDAAGFVISLAAAVVLYFLALKIKWKTEHIRDRKGFKGLPVMAVSLLMGIAIVAIHYIAMSFTRFLPAPEKQVVLEWQWMTPEQLGWVLVGIGLFVSLMAFAFIHVIYRLELATLVADSADYTKEIINKSNDGIITTDTRGHIRSFNESAEKLFGYSADYVMGKHCLLLLPEAAHNSYANLLSNSDPDLPQLINRTHEMQFCKSNGIEFPAELTISPARENSRLVFIGVIKDISERKRLEMEKQKSQEKLEFLITASPVVIYTRSVTGSLPITYVSPNVQKYMGYLPGDITDRGNFWLDLIHPEDRELALPDIKMLHENSKEHIDYRLRLADGHYRWISDTRTLVCDENEKPTVITGSWTDIHDKKIAELNLALNEERLNICLEQANMATWDWVIATGEVIWSEGMLEKLGLPPGTEANFDNVIKAVHPEDARDVKSAFKHSLVSGDEFNLEYRVVWPDRSIHWLHSVGGLINDEEGNPIRMVGVLYAITEQKKLRLAVQSQQQEQQQETA